MPISYKHNCIFVHIPKCAGTSIEFALGMHGDQKNIGKIECKNITKNEKTLFGGSLQHLSSTQIQKIIKNYEEFFKFSFVRNPWDRAVSLSLFHSAEKQKDKDMSKSEFQKVLTDRMQSSPPWFKNQTDYITNKDGEITVDFIGRFENLEQDFKKIAEKIGVDKTLEKRMKLNRRKYEDYYNDETKEIIAEKYSDDIDYFGYKFIVKIKVCAKCVFTHDDY